MADEEGKKEGENQEEKSEESTIEDELAAVAEAAASATVDPKMGSEEGRNIDFLMDVSLEVRVEVGRARMTIQNILQLGQGSIIELTKLAGEPLDIYVNNRHVARGEAVIVNEKFGVRLTDIIAPEDRVGASMLE